MTITAITDRTLADVEHALENQASSESLKGALNWTDLNRIENNAENLYQILTRAGYWSPFTSRGDDWAVNEIIYQDDIDRLRKNIIGMLEGFYRRPDRDQVVIGRVNPDFREVNLWEQSLVDLDFYVTAMIGAYRYSGTFAAGGQSFAVDIPPNYMMAEDGDTLTTEDDVNLLWR